jgi:hypothetical protein
LIANQNYCLDAGATCKAHCVHEQEHIFPGNNPSDERPGFAPHPLLGGLIFGFSAAHPFHVESKRLAKFLLQASVVALGFGWSGL